MIPIILVIFSYLLGSISTSIIICRLFALPDPRTQGSGNAGATNVLRMGNKKLAVITLLGDGLKGMIPVLFSQYLEFNLLLSVIVVLFTLLGHIFPLFFKFKGGKGVASFVGALLVLSPYSGLVFIAIWLLMIKIFKTSSLSALVATFFTPFVFYYFTNAIQSSGLIAMIGILIFWTHQNNIKNIIIKWRSN